MTGPLVYTVRELQAELKCGRHTALKLANEIGVRLSPRRLVVPRVRLEAWLAQHVGGDAMAHDLVQGQEDGRPGPRAETAV